MAKNIFLISIDNLRYDCVGYQPDKRELVKHDVLKHLDTANLDKIAEKSLCFTRCVSTNSYTTAAHASIFTGLYPPRHGVRAFYETRISKDVYTLAETLRVFGYETVMMTDQQDLFVPLELHRGFGHIFHKDDAGLLGFLEENRDMKLFVFVHFYDVHEPFLLSKNPQYVDGRYLDALSGLYTKYDLRMENGPKGDLTYLRRLWMRMIDHVGYKDHATYFPLYVEGVSLFDRGRFGDFIRGLERLDLFGDSLTVIVSDHGEGKSDNHNPDNFTHGVRLYDSVIRVPLIIHHEDIPPGVIDRTVSIADIFPTVCKMALGDGVNDLLPYRVDGMDLSGTGVQDDRAVYSETWRRDGKKTVFPQTLVPSFLEQRSLRIDSKKYVIEGRPEVFSRINDLEGMSDETFLQDIYRGMLCRFEGYTEFLEALRALRKKEITRKDFLENVRNSVEYLSKSNYKVFDLEKDPYEESPVTVDAADEGPANYFSSIVDINAGPGSSEEIFDNREIIDAITKNVAASVQKDVEGLIENKYILSEFICDFLERNNLKIYDGKKITEAVIGSGDFGRFLKDSIVSLQQTVFHNGAEKAAEVKTDSDAVRELELIKQSFAWRIVSGITGFIDTTLFPEGTLRGNLWWKFLLRSHGQTVSDDDAGRVHRVLEKLKSTGGKKILAITYEVPRFDKYSGAHRFFNLLKILRDLDFSVTLLSNSTIVQENYVTQLQQIGVEVIYGRDSVTHFEELGKYFDVVIFHTQSTAEYMDPVKAHFQKARIIFDTSDLHYLRLQREGETTGDQEALRKAKEYKRKELLMAQKSDVVFVVSEDEKDFLMRETAGKANGRIEVVPNVHQVSPTSTLFEQRRGLMFIGAFSHAPNRDAVVYFLKEIFPEVLKKLDVNFYVIGNNPPDSVLGFQGPNVIFTGYVPDVTPYYEKCRLMVAPLRYGAGVKGKLTESMSLGLPFVTTSVGAEGMDLVDRRHCFIADDPGGFSDKLIRLYDDRELWETFRANSLKLALERFSYETVKKRLETFFSEGR